MKRIVCSVLAAGAAALALAAPAAQAEERGPFVEQVRYGDRAGFHELQEARERFYARWDGNPWRQRRFERWYHHRLAELRRHRRGEWREEERERGRW